MHLTPAILEAAYTYLRATPPFNKWKLPESDAVEFRVMAKRRFKDKTWLWGDFDQCANGPVIRLNCLAHKNLNLVTVTMAHEMVHLRQRLSEQKTSASHGPKFKRLAAQVCRQHGFDLKTF